MTISVLSAERRIDYCQRAIAAIEAERFDSPTRPARRARLIAAWEQAVAEAAMVRCGRCGAPLTDPLSQARGLGPCCAAKGQR